MKKKTVVTLVIVSLLILTFFIGEFLSPHFKFSGKATDTNLSASSSSNSSKTISLTGNSYTVKLIAVTSSSTANIAVNSIQKTVVLGGNYLFSDINVKPENIIYEAYAGGLQSIVLNVSKLDSSLLKLYGGEAKSLTFDGTNHIFNLTQITSNNVSILNVDGTDAYLSPGDDYVFDGNLNVHVDSITDSSGNKTAEFNVSRLYSTSFNLTADTGTYVPVNVSISCVSNYTCGEWSSCVNGSQEQTCVDVNRCGENKTQTQACSEPQNNSVNSSNETNSTPLEMCKINEPCTTSPGFFQRIWDWIKGLFGGK